MTSLYRPFFRNSAAISQTMSMRQTMTFKRLLMAWSPLLKLSGMKSPRFLTRMTLMSSLPMLWPVMLPPSATSLLRLNSVTVWRLSMQLDFELGFSRLPRYVLFLISTIFHSHDNLLSDSFEIWQIRSSTAPRSRKTSLCRVGRFL